jgi:hypothetical protein
MDMPPPSSGSKDKPEGSASYLLHGDFFLGLFFYPED